MHIHIDLQGIRDLISFLQIFSHKFCTVALYTNHHPIHKQIVEQYTCSVGQIFVVFGTPDPIINTVGAIDFCLVRNFATFNKYFLPPA